MIQQILVIGGGTTFDTYQDYLAYLKNKEINLERLKFHLDWKQTLASKLGKGFEVFIPKMPNTTNARYNEWKIWFGRILSSLGKNLILIGHSLGGIFLAKYLSENNSPKTIKATILVAAPFEDTDNEESLTDFKLPSSLEKFTKQGGVVYLIQSKDDPTVPFSELRKYERALPKAKTMIFNKRGHFKQETFPEIVRLVKAL